MKISRLNRDSLRQITATLPDGSGGQLTLGAQAEIGW
ncbi:hypothetical protein EHW99_3064 [Erwinia amylovora]|nr:hypothetical protein EHX00_3064 [Erwinia amylovora]QJQ59462.1 hypothetical protein EHW99_3064 [Erwinia amylovora]QJQ63161.1 hypothetical protein EHW98_3064 [Erwinia amylovora]QJQ66963.1 hypothetical protein EHW96_3064 [Erwinia amylovora]QJQ70662.1 hypothetical protein EGZ89_3064 [Erwinia amylovora]